MMRGAAGQQANDQWTAVKRYDPMAHIKCGQSVQEDSQQGDIHSRFYSLVIHPVPYNVVHYRS
jgi:hypothetical protein